MLSRVWIRTWGWWGGVGWGGGREREMFQEVTNNATTFKPWDLKRTTNPPNKFSAPVVIYLFAPWRWRVVAVVGQISSEDVKFTRDDPPCVPRLLFTLRGQKYPELSSREAWEGNSGTLPWTQTAQGAVRHLQTKPLPLFIPTSSYYHYYSNYKNL